MTHVTCEMSKCNKLQIPPGQAHERRKWRRGASVQGRHVQVHENSSDGCAGQVSKNQ